MPGCNEEARQPNQAWRLHVVAVGIMLGMAPWHVMAASPDQAMETGDVQARAWAYSCATCHGVARSAAKGIPTLAGRRAQEMVQMMLDYAQEDNPGGLMGQIARGYQKTELERIARWYEAQPRHQDGQP